DHDVVQLEGHAGGAEFEGCEVLKRREVQVHVHIGAGQELVAAAAGLRGQHLGTGDHAVLHEARGLRDQVVALVEGDVVVGVDGAVVQAQVGNLVAREQAQKIGIVHAYRGRVG